MKYIFGTVTTLLIILSFINRKCVHVFTTVEKDTVNMTVTGCDFHISCSPFRNKCGLHAGKELICVKCFTIQRQVLDYGPRCSEHSGTTTRHWSWNIGNNGGSVLAHRASSHYWNESAIGSKYDRQYALLWIEDTIKIHKSSIIKNDSVPQSFFDDWEYHY